VSTLKLFGPPGTGKTTFLLNSLEQELKRVKPYRVGFLTFTRTARAEALHRTGMSEKELPYLKTIHSICYRQLGVSQSQMIKPKMLREFGQRIGTEITGWVTNLLSDDPTEGGGGRTPTKADILLNLNHLGRHRKVKLREMLQTADESLEWEFSKWFTETYRQWKEAESLFDFTDLLSEYLISGKPLNVDVLFVDEAQDLSKLQWDVVHKLGASAERIYMAGDDDQAIFTWAGASAAAFIREPCDEHKILDQSNRCPKAVMDVAQGIISNVRNRVAKNTRPRAAEGQFETYGYLDQSLFDGDESKFLLYRNHHRGQKLASELEELGVPYTGHISPISDKDVVASITALGKSAKGMEATPAELRSFMDMCDTRLLKKEAEELCAKPALASALLKNSAEADVFKILARLPRKDYLQRCIELHGVSATLKPKLQLQSIHQSKGQEAHTVILDTELAKKTYDGMMNNPDDEHRVWYVGATRAREKLVVLLPMNQLHYQI
jgi:DNA helicase II / ATP-dependent DNA helicase PcrA